MSTVKVNAIDKESGSTLTLGGSGTAVTLHASATSSGFDSGLASVQVFTSSGTWTRPSGITKVIMEVQGAGGSGNGAGGTNYGCGAGGGYAKKLLDVSSISTSTITVGTGGAAVSGGTVTGNDGGASSWADGTNTITGGGGVGHANSSYSNSAGGTGSGGDINITGGIGNHTSYGGGASFMGDGAQQFSQPGQGYGSGGGNGYSSYVSGAGTNGIVIVWEYK